MSDEYKTRNPQDQLELAGYGCRFEAKVRTEIDAALSAVQDHAYNLGYARGICTQITEQMQTVQVGILLSALGKVDGLVKNYAEHGGHRISMMNTSGDIRRIVADAIRKCGDYASDRKT